MEVTTFISALAVAIGLTVSFLSKRIDGLKQDMDRRFQEFNERIDELRQELKEGFREIRQLLYKALKVSQKEGKQTPLRSSAGHVFDYLIQVLLPL
ncbi:MAG: hypothetical protein NZ851_04470 [Aquificaceae bacterium]|nr:hypothetical protein [Aquificaceae bacterium]